MKSLCIHLPFSGLLLFCGKMVYVCTYELQAVCAVQLLYGLINKTFL